MSDIAKRSGLTKQRVEQLAHQSGLRRTAEEEEAEAQHRLAQIKDMKDVAEYV